MLQMLFNNKLRHNYRKALKLKNVQECKEFKISLDKRSWTELITYIDANVIPYRKRTGASINEYFLLHYLDYMSEEQMEIKEKSSAHLMIIYVVMIFIAFAMVLLMRLI